MHTSILTNTAGSDIVLVLHAAVAHTSLDVVLTQTLSREIITLLDQRAIRITVAGWKGKLKVKVKACGYKVRTYAIFKVL